MWHGHAALDAATQGLFDRADWSLRIVLFGECFRCLRVLFGMSRLLRMSKFCWQWRASLVTSTLWLSGAGCSGCVPRIPFGMSRLLLEPAIAHRHEHAAPTYCRKDMFGSRRLLMANSLICRSRLLSISDTVDIFCMSGRMLSYIDLMPPSNGEHK
jgi:hypothetical protein